MVTRTIAPPLTPWQSVQLYARMARPSQLLAVFLVYAWVFMLGLAAGTALSGADFLSGLVPLLLASASVYYAYEFADVETGALTVRTPFSGGGATLVDLGAAPHTALGAAWITLIAGAGGV